MANAQPAADHKKPVGAAGDKQGSAAQGKDKEAVKRAAAPAQDQAKAPAKNGGKEAAAAAKGAGSAPATTPANQENKTAGDRFDRMAVRAKLAVSEPGDAVEREADAVADRVMRAPATPDKTGQAAAPTAGGKPASDTIARAAAPTDKAPPQAAAPAANKASTPASGASPQATAGANKNDIKREAAAPDKAKDKPPAPAASTDKKAAAPEGEIKRKEEGHTADSSSAADKPGTAREIAAQLGSGQSLPAAVRAEFEPKLGRDLADVRIHTDTAAAQAARQLSARAFTYGNHVAFATGEYQPDAESGKRLLAHELAHVMQNDAGDMQQVIQRKKPAGSAPDPKYADPNDVSRAAMDPKLLKPAEKGLQRLRLPAIKSRHAAAYQAQAGKSLARPAGLDRKKNPTKQKEIWLNEMKISNEAKWYKKIGFDPDSSSNSLSFQGAGGKPITGSATEIKERLKIPYWSPDGTWRSMQVDHMLEVQVYKDADQMSNFELLSGAHNMNVGSLLKVEIYANVTQFLADVGKNNSQAKVKEYLDNNEVPFKEVVAGGEGKHAESGSEFWSKNDIKNGKHFTWLIDEKRDDQADGSKPGTFVLKSLTGNAFIAAFPVNKKGVVSGLPSDRVAGMSIQSIDLTPGYDKLSSGQVGTLTANWTLPKSIRKDKSDSITIPLTKIKDLKYAGALGSLPGCDADIRGASPLAFNTIEIVRGEVHADGELSPTLDLLDGKKIPVEWRGKDVRFYYDVPLDSVKSKFKVPGMTVTDASLTLFFGTGGLGADGRILFSIAKMGEGQLHASIVTKGDEPIFNMDGVFNVDANLFDECRLEIAYNNTDGVSGKGHLGITNPDKIKGIKSASIDAGFAKDEFFATGGVEPKIPGLQEVTIGVTYNKTTNALTIHGEVALNEGIPGVQGGKITVDVTKTGDTWEVAASGNIKPTFKGLGEGLMLVAKYDKGKFNVSVEGAEVKFGENDRFKGTLTAGITNQTVDKDGNVSGDGGDAIRPYGHGELTGKLSEWLTVNAAATIDTQGDVYLEGGLTVPSLKIFGRKSPFGEGKEEKEIVSVDTPKIPIVGITVGGVGLGITAHVSGSLSAVCWVGPATLDGVNVKVLRFRPGTNDPITLQGGGDLNLPAYAGLKLSVTGNVDLDAGLVALGGDLTADAKLGADANFNSHLALAWSKETGIDIMDTTTITVKPKLEFEVKGGFHVDVNAIFTSFRVWHKEWELGHFEYGPDFNFSAMFQMGYNDKDGFSLKPDPSKTGTPDLNNTAMYEGLLKDHPKQEQMVPDEKAPPGTPTLGYGDVCEEPPAANASFPEDKTSCIDGSDGGVFPQNNGSAPDPNLPWQDDNALQKDLGTGLPLPQTERATLEPQYNRDFSNVRIHVGEKAQQAARRLSARAFTVGNDIAFAAGEYQPDTDEGRRLLAHELTHVVQQQQGATRMVMRGDGDPPAAAPASTAAPSSSATVATPPTTTGSSAGSPPPSSGAATPAGEFDLTLPLRIPQTKSRHVASYQLMARNRQLRRRAGYTRAGSRTTQRDTWLSSVTASWSRVPAANRATTATGLRLTLNCAGGAGVTHIDRDNEEAMDRRLKIPNWTSTGERLNSEETDSPTSGGIGYQVDHIVEYQLGGADDITNLELLNQRNNGSSGSLIDSGLEAQVQAQINSNPTAPSLTGYTGAKDSSNRPIASGVMAWKDIVITRVETSGSEGADHRRERNSSFWSKQQIDAMDHVLPLLANTPAASSAGSPDNFVLLSPTGNLVVSRFPHTASNLTINVERDAPSRAGGIAGFTLQTVTLNPDYNNAPLNANIGSLVGRINLGNKVTLPTGRDIVSMPISQAKAPGEHSGRMGVPSATAGLPNVAEFTPMSQLDLSNLTFGQGVFGRAVLHPSHPALSGLNVPATIENGRVGLFYTVDATALAERFRIPGLTIDSANVTFGYDGEAFSVEGGTRFTIRNFGQGHLEAMVDSEGKFQLEGGFSADSRLFDRADMSLWYRSTTGFGGTGTLAITNPNKIRGVRAASVTATYDNGVFSATGTVEPNIPGVQSAGLSVRYGPDESGADSLLIAGDLALAAGIPGINGGQIHVELAQRNEQWSVAGTGDIRPNLPGVTSNIHLEYRDGIFTGELSMDYARSIFSGNITVGLTNRAVSPDGEAQTTGEPEDTLKLYGSGTLTARLTEQIQGSIGLKVRPTGDILISGSIGLAEAITIFDQYPDAAHAQRELFHMPTVSIPLVGIAVGGNTVGLALTINGRINGHAFVGPGRLTQAEIRVEDFNPAQPESLHITGDARFNLPAEAGVDASLDAGLSLGAAIIRATAGINVTAGVAARADVSPSAHIDWRPDTGLHLHADLNASLSPVLRFGVNGYAEVVADAFVTSFTLWRKDWNLAQREIGSSLALGVNVPVDYYSDGRGVMFDPNAVTFQVPELNADLLGQLMNDNGSEHAEGRRAEA